MRRLAVAVSLVCVGLLTGCGERIAGTPLAGARPESPAAPTATSARPPSSASASPTSGGTASSLPGVPPENLCALLTFADLPYKNTDPAAPPTEVGFDQDYDQSCMWKVSVDSVDVGVTLRYRKGRGLSIDQANGEYRLADRTLSYRDQTASAEYQGNCVLTMDYAGGGIGIIVIDGTFRFGPLCEQGKHIAEVLVSREPR